MPLGALFRYPFFSECRGCNLSICLFKITCCSYLQYLNFPVIKYLKIWFVWAYLYILWQWFASQSVTLNCLCNLLLLRQHLHQKKTGQACLKLLLHTYGIYFWKIIGTERLSFTQVHTMSPNSSQTSQRGNTSPSYQTVTLIPKQSLITLIHLKQAWH